MVVVNNTLVPLKMLSSAVGDALGEILGEEVGLALDEGVGLLLGEENNAVPPNKKKAAIAIAARATIPKMIKVFLFLFLFGT